MDQMTGLVLARIEGKINIIARAVGFILGIVAGFGAYFAVRDESWSVYAGFAAALLTVFYVDIPIRSLERRITKIEDRLENET